MEGTARTRPVILKVVSVPYVQYCPCEAFEQNPESELKVIELSYCHHSILSLKNKHFRKMSKLDEVNVLVQSGIWLILCQLMAILAKLLDMDFKFVLPRIYINFDVQTNFEVNQTQISHSILKNTSKSH